MRKDEAIMVLTKKLVENGHVYFIESKRSQDFYERTAKFFQPINLENQIMRIEEKSSVNIEKRYNEGGYIEIRPKYLDEEAVENIELNAKCSDKSVTQKIKEADFKQDEMKKMGQFHATNVILEHIVAKTSQFGANYFFIEEFEITNPDPSKINCQILAFPYSIITEKEIEQLKYLYIGDISEEIVKAAKVLNLEKELKVSCAELAKRDPKKFLEHFYFLPKERKVAIIEELWDILEKEGWGKGFHKELMIAYDELITEAGRNRLEKKIIEGKNG